jgi:hypothetical protein
VLRWRRLTIPNAPHLVGRWLIRQAVVMMLRRSKRLLRLVLRMLLMLLMLLKLLMLLLVLLVDALLRLRVAPMWGELHWNVPSSICYVGQTCEALEIQLQVVVRTTSLPTRWGILDMCRCGARAIRRLKMGHWGLVAQHLGLT